MCCEQAFTVCAAGGGARSAAPRRRRERPVPAALRPAARGKEQTDRQTDRQTDTVITVLRCVRVQVAAARVLLRHGADVNAQCPPRFDRRRAVKNRQTDRQTR